LYSACPPSAAPGTREAGIRQPQITHVGAIPRRNMLVPARALSAPAKANIISGTQAGTRCRGVTAASWHGESATLSHRDACVHHARQLSNAGAPKSHACMRGPNASVQFICLRGPRHWTTLAVQKALVFQWISGKRPA